MTVDTRSYRNRRLFLSQAHLGSPHLISSDLVSSELGGGDQSERLERDKMRSDRTS